MQIRGFCPTAMAFIGLIVAAIPTPASAIEQAGSAPLQLKTFLKKPISSSATRTVKKPDGSYTTLSSRRLKKTPATPEPGPLPVPLQIASDAITAYAAVMDTRVRIVSEDELNEIDLGADVTPLVPSAVATTVETAPLTGSRQIHNAGRTADRQMTGMTPATTANSPSPNPADTPLGHKSWVQRMVDGLNVVLAAATAAAKVLFG